MSQNNNNSFPPSELGPQLVIESAAWRALLALLEDEEHALVEGEADRVAQLNASKLSQLNALGELARTRQAALSFAGHTPDHAGMTDWLTQHGQHEHHLCWQQLCEMEQQAQATNERIGVLIDLRLTSTRQALNVLVQAATREGGLYDQAGQAVNAGKGKPIVAA